jgi:hypothetical protein
VLDLVQEVRDHEPEQESERAEEEGVVGQDRNDPRHPPARQAVDAGSHRGRDLKAQEEQRHDQPAASIGRTAQRW